MLHFLKRGVFDLAATTTVDHYDWRSSSPVLDAFIKGAGTEHIRIPYVRSKEELLERIPAMGAFLDLGDEDWGAALGNAIILRARYDWDGGRTARLTGGWDTRAHIVIETGRQFRPDGMTDAQRIALLDWYVSAAERASVSRDVLATWMAMAPFVAVDDAVPDAVRRRVLPLLQDEALIPRRSWPKRGRLHHLKPVQHMADFARIDHGKVPILAAANDRADEIERERNAVLAALSMPFRRIYQEKGRGGAPFDHAADPDTPPEDRAAILLDFLRLAELAEAPFWTAIEAEEEPTRLVADSSTKRWRWERAIGPSWRRKHVFDASGAVRLLEGLLVVPGVCLKMPLPLLKGAAAKLPASAGALAERIAATDWPAERKAVFLKVLRPEEVEEGRSAAAVVGAAKRIEAARVSMLEKRYPWETAIAPAEAHGRIGAWATLPREFVMPGNPAHFTAAYADAIGVEVLNGRASKVHLDDLADLRDQQREAADEALRLYREQVLSLGGDPDTETWRRCVICFGGPPSSHHMLEELEDGSGRCARYAQGILTRAEEIGAIGSAYWRIVPPAGSKPSAKWIADAAKLLDDSVFRSRVIADIGAKRPPLARRTRAEDEALTRAWVLALGTCPPAEVAPALYEFARARLGPATEKLANAAIWALENLADGGGAPFLARLAARTKYPKFRKRIEKAMERAAEAAGVSRAELDELIAPAHGLQAGRLERPVGEGAAILEARSGKVGITWRDVGGTIRKAAPKALREADPEGVKAARALAKEIDADLAVQRDRLDRLYLKDASWDYATWRGRYADHGLVAVHAQRLVWILGEGEEAKLVLPTERGIEDVAGHPVDPGDRRVRLWHPLGSAEDVIFAWRDRLAALGIVQPFRQAWRETYALTEPERTTRTYSNRFAGHILRQHKALRIANANGWSCRHRIWADVANDEPWHIRLPEVGLQAEFWNEPAGDGDADGMVLESQAYVHVATDRVMLHRLDEADRWGRGAPVALEDAPPVILSEVLRHADLLVSTGSIALDPEWIDRGAEAEHPSDWHRAAEAYRRGRVAAPLGVAGVLRRTALAALLPRLEGAEAYRLDDKHLHVQGVNRPYRIHLDSGAVWLEPSGRHICIVRAPSPEPEVLLPFTGDAMLSLVLSKAVMLRQDDRIEDGGIRAQIGI